uniref:IPPc domain-containing protein n=2 Tax=Mesocestoides corti TaxID=53468 RepID=A0A5K3EZL7_MESCO
KLPYSVYCCTWNVGDEAPPRQDLSKLLGVNSQPHPDVIFLGLQEVVRSADWYESFKLVLAPLDYVLIKYRNCWAIWIYAFVKRHLLPALNNIESELTAFGYAGIMGNKGACSVRFEVCGVNMACVSAHFTAHTEKRDERINDYHDVLKDQTFRDPDVNLLMDHDYVFWMGDLNFRTESLDKDGAERLIFAKRLDSLMKYDQLKKAMDEELVFHDFKEGEITFPPTFKFDKGTTNYDSSKKRRVPSYTDRILYMQHNDFALDHNVQLDAMGRKTAQKSRKKAVRGGPSASDRPPRRANDTSTDHPELRLVAYDYLPEYTSSDHRPVYARFEAKVPNCWFQLPVRFIHCSDRPHPVNKDLTFLYAVMDPPPIITEGCPGEGQRALKLRSRVRSSSTDDVSRASRLAINPSVQDLVKQRCNNLLTVKQTNLSLSCGGHEMFPPATLQVQNWDWVSVLPADFYDFWKDEFTVMSASTSSLSSSGSTLDEIVEGNANRFEKIAALRSLIPAPSSVLDSSLLKGKIDHAVLERCHSDAIQLVYMSKSKNCPQGYSDIIKLSPQNLVAS